MLRSRLLLALLLALLSCTQARADATVVQDITMSINGEDTHHTVVAYFQGEKARVEVQGENFVILYDLSNDKVCWLDTARKSYTILALGQIPRAREDWAHKLIKPKTDIKIDVKEGDRKKTICGLDSSKKTVVARIRESSEDSLTRSYSGGLGTNMGLGGIPLGVPETEKKITDKIEDDPTAHVDGDYWLAKANGISTLPLYAQTLPVHTMTVPLVATLTDKMSGSMPMASHVMVRLPGHNHPIEMTTEVKSVTSASLDRFLFIVPADYRLVD